MIDPKHEQRVLRYAQAIDAQAWDPNSSYFNLMQTRRDSSLQKARLCVLLADIEHAARSAMAYREPTREGFLDKLRGFFSRKVEIAQ